MKWFTRKSSNFKTYTFTAIYKDGSERERVAFVRTAKSNENGYKNWTVFKVALLQEKGLFEQQSLREICDLESEIKAALIYESGANIERIENLKEVKI